VSAQTEPSSSNTSQLDDAAWWVELLIRSASNPLIFVTEVLGVTTAEPWQQQALRDVGEVDRVSIRSGHGVGKTAYMSWLVLWFLLTRRRAKVLVAANSQDQLRDTIWPEIGRWAQKLPEGLKEIIDVQKERVVNLRDPEGCFAVARTASKDNPEALQGFHEDNMMILMDEASGIDDIVFEVGMGALSTEGAKVVMAGNPTRSSGFFHATHHTLRDRWRCRHVSCLDVPRARGHIQDVISRYGENSNAYRVRVLGEFPTADDETVIPLELVLAAVNRDVTDLPYYPVWGVDVARFGSDRTAIAKRAGDKLLEPIKWWASTDLMATAGRIKNEYEETDYDFRPSEILIDSIGLGAGVYDRCKELGLPARAINVAEAAASRENCRRLRDELWFKGREWFQAMKCSIPNDETLIAELTAPIYSFTSNGKFAVETKDEMKKRGLRSPDFADAFLLTFAAGMRKKIDRHRRPAGAKKPSAWAL
jgi:phage terminase large subunit